MRPRGPLRRPLLPVSLRVVQPRRPQVRRGVRAQGAEVRADGRPGPEQRVSCETGRGLGGADGAGGLRTHALRDIVSDWTEDPIYQCSGMHKREKDFHRVRNKVPIVAKSQIC